MDRVLEFVGANLVFALFGFKQGEHKIRPYGPLQIVRVLAKLRLRPMNHDPVLT